MQSDMHGAQESKAAVHSEECVSVEDLLRRALRLCAAAHRGRLERTMTKLGAHMNLSPMHREIVRMCGRLMHVCRVTMQPCAEALKRPHTRYARVHRDISAAQ